MTKCKWKWLAVPLLACCAQVARGQCSGYSAGQPNFPTFSPSQVAAQGYMTATMTVTAETPQQVALSGAMPSHAVSITQGTYGGLSWTTFVPSGVTATARMSYSVNGGAWVDDGAIPLTGTGYTGAEAVGNIERLRIVLTDTSGNTTQDIVKVTTVAGTGPSFTSQDLNAINYYMQGVAGFSGPSMANACTLCQNQPYKCINKMHHPKQHWQATNSTSGEYHDAGWVYGNVACETCAVSYTGSSPFLSFNPGDLITFNVEDQVICDEFGIIFDNNGGDTFNIQTEYAFTTSATLGSMCQLIPEPNGGHAIECPISYFCKKGSAPPDFNPAYIASDRNCATPGFCTEADIPVFPPYWLLGGAGVRFTINGVGVWQFPFYDAEGFVVGVRKKSDFINLLFNIADAALPSPFGANAISCTNYDLGTSPFSVWP